MFAALDTRLCYQLPPRLPCLAHEAVQDSLTFVQLRVYFHRQTTDHAPDCPFRDLSGVGYFFRPDVIVCAILAMMSSSL
jgi:hypothetical protein